MNIGGRHYRTIWAADDGGSFEVIDQTQLPHAFRTRTIDSVEGCAEAIETMIVRGAPLIGVTAAYGVAMALRADSSDAALARAYERLRATRPTAVNLVWALDRVRRTVAPVAPSERFGAALRLAAALCDEDAARCRSIGEHGAAILRDLWLKGGRSRPVQVLTHCNAGWLATVDWGTAIAPIYVAHEQGIPVHVWVDETRPRNQGMLTAFELAEHGVPHHVVVDNAGGHLMQHGEVDVCITGTDRTTAIGDVCNKIGTYLKALAARDNGVPFYVACPSSSIDWSLRDGVAEIPIEERSEAEITHVTGEREPGEIATVRVTPGGVRARNPGFDVTPARLVTGIITEAGICDASEEALRALRRTLES